MKLISCQIFDRFFCSMNKNSFLYEIVAALTNKQYMHHCSRSQFWNYFCSIFLRLILLWDLFSFALRIRFTSQSMKEWIFFCFPFSLATTDFSPILSHRREKIDLFLFISFSSINKIHRNTFVSSVWNFFECEQMFS